MASSVTVIRSEIIIFQNTCFFLLLFKGHLWPCVALSCLLVCGAMYIVFPALSLKYKRKYCIKKYKRKYVSTQEIIVVCIYF